MSPPRDRSSIHVAVLNWRAVIEPHFSDCRAVLEHVEGATGGNVPNNVHGEVVERVERVDIGLGATLGDLHVPLLDELVQVCLHERLEVAHRLCAERVRQGLALTRVLSLVDNREHADYREAPRLERRVVG